jgi:hypothetical protein
MENLFKWNYGAAFLHLGATIAAITLLTDKSKREVQMTRLKFDENAPQQQSRVDIPVALENESKIDLKFIIVYFFAITSVAHLLYATDFFGLKWYSKSVLGVGWNPYRWVEYSLSASLMIYLISAASGTKDQVSAISAALITPGLMINGFTTERELKQNTIFQWSENNKKGVLTSGPPNVDVDPIIILSNLLPGWFLYGVHWYIILSNYYKLQKEAKAASKSIDGSVSFMVYSQLAFFSLFGVIQSFQVYRWLTLKPSRSEPSFFQYEKAYIALSAITKLALGGTVLYSLRN